MTGAPTVCLGLHIVHDRNVAQKTEVPFKLNFSTTTYTPGQDVNIKLASPDSLPFKGFVIYAHRMIGDRERPVGEFVTFPPNKARQVACSGEE
ncbi:hypothetical protein MAR_026417, partial [Mya arenaria]